MSAHEKPKLLVQRGTKGRFRRAADGGAPCDMPFCAAIGRQGLGGRAWRQGLAAGMSGGCIGDSAAVTGQGYDLHRESVPVATPSVARGLTDMRGRGECRLGIFPRCARPFSRDIPIWILAHKNGGRPCRFGFGLPAVGLPYEMLQSQLRDRMPIALAAVRCAVFASVWLQRILASRRLVRLRPQPHIPAD